MPGCDAKATSISPELDAVSAKLDLLINPPQELELPVRAPAGEITGSEKASSLSERTSDEAPVSLRGIPQKAARETISTQKKLARGATRQGL